MTVRSGTSAVDADLEDQDGRGDQRGEGEQGEPHPAQLGRRLRRVGRVSSVIEGCSAAMPMPAYSGIRPKTAR